jgi:L-lactate dehydrogenase (cytochrome)
MKPRNIADLRRQAFARLPRLVFDYVDGGAQDEITLRRNCADFEQLILRPRVLVDVSRRDLHTKIFSRRLSMPLLLAPTGLTGLIWPSGEAHAALAAKDAGIGYCLSSNATMSIEQIAQETAAPFWFQIYLMKDKELTRSMIARAKSAGCDSLVITVDLAVAGRRERDLLNGFTIPPKLSIANALNVLSRPHWLKSYLLGPDITFGNFSIGMEQSFAGMARFISEQFDQSATWETVSWAKSIFGGNVLLKGILTAEDAKRAVQAGADGVIVSNHGGRQLDGVSSSIAALPKIADAVGKQVPILIDGGVRRGADIARACALGATACLIGRPFLYGLGAAGRQGVSTAIELLRSELDNALALLGVPSITELGVDAVQQ